MIVLVDTSVWIEHDRATGSAHHQWLAARLRTRSEDVATTEPVAMELLAGARSDEAAERLRRALSTVTWLPIDPIADFEGAATLYRRCRAAGVTPRGLLDCLVAQIAIRRDVALLALDADVSHLARAVPELRLADPF